MADGETPVVAQAQAAADAAQDAANAVAETAREERLDAAIEAAEEREEQAAELGEEIAAAAMRTEIVRQVETKHREIDEWRAGLETRLEQMTTAMSSLQAQVSEIQKQPAAPPATVEVVSSTPATLDSPATVETVTVQPDGAPAPTVAESVVPAAPRKRVRLI